MEGSEVDMTPLLESPSLNGAESHTPLPALNNAGGDMTRSLVKASRQPSSLKRVNSEPSLLDVEESASAVQDMMAPQGFRRAFLVRSKGAQSAPSPPSFMNQWEEVLYPFLGYYGDDDDEPTQYDGHQGPRVWEDLGRDIAMGVKRIESGQLTPSRQERARSLASVADKEGGSPTYKIVFTLIKSFIGSAVLFLPAGFRNGGWLFSNLVLMFMAVVSTYCMVQLVDCRLERGGSFADLGRFTYGYWGKLSVEIAIILSQFGFCCVYVSFVAANTHDLLRAWGWVNDANLAATIFFQAIFLIPLAWVRRLRYFAISNLVADAFILVGLLLILGYACHVISGQSYHSTVKPFNSKPSKFSVFLGTAVYAFEGIGLVIPTLRSGNAAAQAAFSKTLSWCIVGITSFFCLFGTVCYFAFGEGTESVITFNLPCGEAWVYFVQVAYCLALILTLPVMAFPAIRYIENMMTPAVFAPGKTTTRRKWKKNANRALLTIVIMLVAYVGSSSLDHFVSLIGAFACAPLAFIFPAMFHLKIFPNQPSGTRIRNYLILGFGFAVMAFSTIITLIEWNSGSASKSPCP